MRQHEFGQASTSARSVEDQQIAYESINDLQRELLNFFKIMKIMYSSLVGPSTTIRKIGYLPRFRTSLSESL